MGPRLGTSKKLRALPNYPALGLRKKEAFQHEPIGSRESQHESSAHVKKENTIGTDLD